MIQRADVETELLRCVELFAVCYAKDAPVPPDWVRYYDELKAVDGKRTWLYIDMPESVKYPCRWCSGWEGWMALVKMYLAAGVTRYISTLKQEEQILARIEIERSRWWFETNSYFIKMVELFQWTESDVSDFFNLARSINKNA